MVSYEPLDPALEGSCSSALDACLDRGTPPDDCLRGESDACADCVGWSLYVCATETECAAELQFADCCVRGVCAAGDDVCVAGAIAPGGACASEFSGLEACVTGTVGPGICPLVAPACRGTGSDPDPDPDLDRIDCRGTASTTGEILGEGVPLRYSYARARVGGELAIALMNSPLGVVIEGERAVVVLLRPIPGTLSYPPTTGLAQCGVTERHGTAWDTISSASTGCEVILDRLDFASAPGVCDGTISGIFRGIFGSDAFGGAFVAPLPMAESEAPGPSCMPTDGPCSSHDDCCSESCSLFVGVCN
jgi:hypothetical protein